MDTWLFFVKIVLSFAFVSVGLSLYIFLGSIVFSLLEWLWTEVI
jgi:hypothetical protein